MDEINAPEAFGVTIMSPEANAILEYRPPLQSLLLKRLDERGRRDVIALLETGRGLRGKKRADQSRGARWVSPL